MAFSYLDDDAFPLATDDGPHSSGAAVQLLANAEAIHQERFAKCGVSYRLSTADDSSVRLCSPWPSAFGPKWMYFHPSEAIATATVKLRIEKVELSKSAGAGSGDLVRVCVTTGDARGRLTIPPFVQSDSRWTTAADGGQTLAATTTDSTLSLTVRVDGRNAGDPGDPLAGWVAFYVWIWSIITSSAEDTGGIVEQDQTTGAVGVLWAGSGPASTTNPIERCLAIQTMAGNQLPGAQYGELRQIGYYRTTNLAVNGTSDAALFLVPPVTDSIGLVDLYDGSPQVSLYTMGVLALAGYSIAADRGTFDVGSEGFYSDEPVKWESHQALAGAISRLSVARFPVWSIEPARVKDVAGSTNHTFWRLLSQDLRQIADNGTPTSSPISTNSATPTNLAAAAVANPPPAADLNGYRAIVTLVALRARGSGQWGYQPQIKLRLAAYDWAGALVVAGAYTQWQQVAILAPYLSYAPEWVPIEQNLWGAVACDDWQFRGYLMDGPSGGDWRRVSHHVVTMPETSITYPAAIKLQGYLNATNEHIELAVLGFGLASKGYSL